MHPLRCVGIFSSSQRAFALIHRTVVHGFRRYVDAAERRERGKGCVLSSAKISLLFRTVVISDEKCFYFSISRTEKQKHGDFFSNCPLFLSSPSSFSFPSLLASHLCRRPPVGCPLAHDALARGDAHPRLAHSASFHFFAFTPHLQFAEQLLVRGEGFCISSIFTGG